VFGAYEVFLTSILTLLRFCLTEASNNGLLSPLVGGSFFSPVGGPNVLRSHVILTFSTVERFWNELDRDKYRPVFSRFSLLFFVNPWGENAIKTLVILTISFWGVSEPCVFLESKKRFCDLILGTLDARICYKNQRIFDYSCFANRHFFWWCFRGV